jgi:hypothetical protein
MSRLAHSKTLILGINHILYELRILSKEEAKQLEVELFEIEILDLKGELRELALKSYHRLLKDVDKPIYLVRTDE